MMTTMYKDFGLILDQAAELTIPMPATAAAQQMYAAARILEKEEDFAVVIRFMKRLAGVSSYHND